MGAGRYPAPSLHEGSKQMPDIPPIRQLVREYLAQRPGQRLEPWQIAKGISDSLDGHPISLAAVTYICSDEALEGRLVQATRSVFRVEWAPTFSHPAQDDADAKEQ
jgi:hypothetical protein